MAATDIRTFNNLQDQYRSLGMRVDLIDTRAGFTIFNLKDAVDILPFSAPISRLNFFVFNFIKQGTGWYSIDDQRFNLAPGTVYFTNPGHFRSYEWAAIEEVYLITLSEEFLRENVHPDVFNEFPFLLAETFPARVVSPVVFAEFEQLYRQVHKEYVSESPFRKKLIANLFVVLLLKIKEYCWLDYNPIYEGNRSSKIVRDFKRLLEQHYRDVRAGKAERLFVVQDYADAQSLHPNYLSNVIKAKTGKPVATWIAEKTVAEARNLLKNASLSVKEIAYQLSFAEAAHFTNYFKKHTGLSPVEYRKQQASS